MTDTKDREVLLRLVRQYSKEETVALLNQELKNAEFKNGELVSENAELKHEIKILRGNLTALQKAEKPKLTKADLKEMRFVELNRKLDAKSDKIRMLQSDLDLWRSKYCNLVVKIGQCVESGQQKEEKTPT